MTKFSNVVRTESGSTGSLNRNSGKGAYKSFFRYPNRWNLTNPEAQRKFAGDEAIPPKAGEEGRMARNLHNSQSEYYGEELKSPNSPVEIKKGPDGMKYACNLITGVCVLAAGIAAKHYLGFGGRTRKNRKPRRKSKKTRK